jgi:tetratricopeptide (TPR) repeat protein
MGLKNDALHIAEEGLREFPDDHPEIYMSLGDAYFEMGWVEEAKSILNEGLRKFPGDEDIQNLLVNWKYGKRPSLIHFAISPLPLFRLKEFCDDQVTIFLFQA